MSEDFRSTLAVVKHLKSLGFKVSKSAVYRDADAGKLPVRADGTILAEAVDAYAKRWLGHLKPRAGRKRTKQGADDLAATERKLLADTTLREAQAARQQLKLEIERGKLMPVEEYLLQLGMRAMFFRTQVEVFCTLLAPRVVAMCNGDEARLPDVLDLMRREADGWLDAFSQDKEFRVE